MRQKYCEHLKSKSDTVDKMDTVVLVGGFGTARKHMRVRGRGRPRDGKQKQQNNADMYVELSIATEPP